MSSSSVLTIGRPVLRYSKKLERDSAMADGLPNYLHITQPARRNESAPLLEKGISPIRQVSAPEGKRPRGVVRLWSVFLRGTASLE
jgi:hypothetical protein